MPSRRSLCSYEGCKNSKAKDPSLTFHRFPKDECRRAEWILRSGNLKLYDLTNDQINMKRICSEHFTADDVMYISLKGMRKLKDSALPIHKSSPTNFDDLQDVDEDTEVNAIDLPVNSNFNISSINVDLPELISHSESMLTELDKVTTSGLNSTIMIIKDNTTEINNSNIESNNDSHENSLKKLQEEIEVLNKKLLLQNEYNKKVRSWQIQTLEKKTIKYKEKIRNLQKIVVQKNKKINNLERKLNECKNNNEFTKSFEKLNENIKDFFKMQINHIKQQKWNDEEKQFALSLYFKSPKAYNYLHDEKRFSLPCVTIIRRWINGSDLTSEKIKNSSELSEMEIDSTTE